VGSADWLLGSKEPAESPVEGVGISEGVVSVAAFDSETESGDVLCAKTAGGSEGATRTTSEIMAITFLKASMVPVLILIIWLVICIAV